MKITVIVGSLRRDSFNRRLADNIVQLMTVADPGCTAVFADLNLPLFNQDLEADLPAAVRQFKAGIAAADGVLVVTPEYNHALPGVLKNALDWASRPASDGLWRGKPVALAGASPSPLGTALSQATVRPVLSFIGAKLMAAPELYVAGAMNAFDDQGQLVEPTRLHTAKFAAAFVDFIRG